MAKTTAKQGGALPGSSPQIAQMDADAEGTVATGCDGTLFTKESLRRYAEAHRRGEAVPGVQVTLLNGTSLPLVEWVRGPVQPDGSDQSEGLDGADALALATTAAHIAEAGRETHVLPSQAQIEAGNYKKGRVNIQGLTVAIEVARGGTRSGTGKDGKAWSTQMKDAYGYICTGANGADGDKVDCFLGDDPTSERVFVIDQVDPDTRAFDEHKVVLGATSEDEARTIYLRNYEAGWAGLGALTEMDMAAFKEWLKTEDCSKPVAGDASREDAEGQRDAKEAAGFERDLFLVGDATEWEVVTDRKALRPGELMRVRQLMSMSNAINENDRFYPDRVMRPAVEGAQARVRAGAMIMELIHPETVRSRTGRWQYVDNPDRKSARIDSLEMLPNGQVWADFTVLDLPCGHEVADGYNGGRPLGTSMRFGMQSHEARVDGRLCDVADSMDIYSFDHVPNPAFPQTKRNWVLLTDSQRAEFCEGAGCGCGDSPRAETQRPQRDARQEGDGASGGAAGEEVDDGQIEADNRHAAGDEPPPYEVNTDTNSTPLLSEGGSLLAEVPGLEASIGASAGAAAANSHAVLSPSSAAIGMSPAADGGGDRIRRTRGATETGVRRSAGTARRRDMKPELKAALNKLYRMIGTGADAAEIASARQAVTDEIKLSERAGDDVTEAVEMAMRADEMAGKLTVVQGNATGTNAEGTGWGKDLHLGARTTTAASLVPGEEEARKLQEAGGAGADAGAGEAAKGAESVAAPGMDAATADFIARLKQQHETQVTEDARKAAVQTACDAERANLGELAEEDKDYILQIVGQTARDASDVPDMVAAQCDAFMKRIAKARLQGAGFHAAAGGQTVNDPATPGTAQVMESHPVLDAVFDSVKGSPPAYLRGVSQFLTAADDHVRRSNIQGADNPDSAATRARRVANLKKIVPIMDSYARVYHGARDAGEWFARMDALSSGGEKAFSDAVMGGRNADALSDSVLQANLYNQPSILMALIIQKLWDSKMLQFVQGIGSETAAEGGAGWAMQTRNGGIGKELRIPVEFRDYANMTGYAIQPINNYDPGYLVPENTGVNEVRFGTVWLSYGVQLRSVALQISREAMLSLGKGPAGYPAFARGLWHMTHDMQLRIDKALADEMWQIADEYGCTTVTAESPNYTNNSVYNSSGGITVNLNPTKRANAAISGDASVTYGTNIVAAIRLKTAGNGSSSPYAGGATYITPVVRPRTNVSLTTAGLVTSAVQNPFTITQTGGSYNAPVLGYLDNGTTPQIHNLASGAVANFAVDWNNGVLLFTSGYNAIANNSGIVADAAASTTAITYAYVTNFDDFLVNTASYGTGITQEAYLNGVLTRIEKTSATMASSPRYVEPDLCLGSPVASTWLTSATKFWNWASPKDTELFPTPEYYASQNGINFARSNVPSQVGDSRLLLTRVGSTKYGIDEPFTVRGPQFATDGTTGLPINREAALGYEYSVICTPQVQDQSGNILNPVARQVMLR